MLVTSEPLLAELERVLADPLLAKVISAPGELVRLISEVAVAVAPDREITAIKHDPADNRVLEAAIAARADCIVSGDAGLLDVGIFEGLRIVTPREGIASETQ